MVPACGTSMNDPSKQTTFPDAAKYHMHIRHELGLDHYLLDHRRVAVPKHLIIASGNENSACVREDRTLDAGSRDTHAFGLAATAALAFLSALEWELPPTTTSASSRLRKSITSDSCLCNKHRAVEEENLGCTSCGEPCVAARGCDNMQISSVFLFGFLDKVGYPSVLE